MGTLDEAFQVAPVALVDGIVLNAFVASVDRATGQPCHPLLISINATRGLFAGLNLDAPELDPVLCLRKLSAIVSPHPYNLEPVRPAVAFDLSKYKFVEGMDVVAGLDSRPDLLALKPVEFEHLIRRLFEAIGMKACVTQASRDDAVDAVATNDDPVVSGCASSRPSATATSWDWRQCMPWPGSWPTRPQPRESSSPRPGSAKSATTSPHAPAGWT
jgi:restriction system protein